MPTHHASHKPGSPHGEPHGVEPHGAEPHDERGCQFLSALTGCSPFHPDQADSGQSLTLRRPPTAPSAETAPAGTVDVLVASIIAKVDWTLIP